MKQTKIQQIMKTVKFFPGMPWTATELLSQFDQRDTAAAQIEKILRYDPGLTASVLKLTNSAYFGLPAKIGSVKQAVILLGEKRLTQLVLASCVRDVIDKAVEGYNLPAGELLRHSIAVSVAAETLVRELGIAAVDVAFTAALLHDVGKLALGRFVKEDLEKIEGFSSKKMAFETAEQYVLGTNHAELGAIILANWSFPADIISAVQWHHTPDGCEQKTSLIDIVHVADVLSVMIGFGGGCEGLRHQVSAAAARRLGLTPFLLEKIASQTLQWVRELSDIFGSN